MNGRLPLEPELVPYSPDFPPGRRWLVLAPHADDETFGPGGTLALAVSRGVSVCVAVLTDGAAQGDPDSRRAEVQAAAEVLGLSMPRQFPFADRALASSGDELLGTLTGLLTETTPETVLVPSPVELHPDHRAAAVALQRALRRRPGPGWVAAYEVGSALRPNLLVDVTSVWEIKERAAACYVSQLAFRPYARAMEALGAFRSLTLSGTGYAEAFHIQPADRVAGLSAGGWAAAMGAPDGVTGAPAELLRRVLVRVGSRARGWRAPRTGRP